MEACSLREQIVGSKKLHNLETDKNTSLGLDGGCSLRAGDSGGLEGWLLPPPNPDPTHFPYCVSQLLKS